jgi:hypothetical protein
MTDAPQTPQSAQDDLAFLRAVVQSGGGMQKPFGQTYLAGGLCYGAQLLLSALDSGALWPRTPVVSITIASAPTVAFAGILTWVIWRNRAATPPAGAQRAIGNVFGCLGMSNLALIVVIGAVALRERSLTTWLIYPCAVFVLQGAGWLVAYTLRRRVWMGLIAAGWMITASVMAIYIEAMPVFIPVAGAGLMLLMALPGWLILRGSKTLAG